MIDQGPKGDGLTAQFLKFGALGSPRGEDAAILGEAQHGIGLMTLLNREFYRSFRGPEVGDEDNWRLIFDPSTTSLRVRHSWRTSRHSGVDEISLDEFVAEQSAARDALMAILFERAMADA